MPGAVYTIESINTKYYLTTQGAGPGATVVTANGKDGVPADTNIEIVPPLAPGPTICSITGPNDLYVALPPGADAGTKLIWSDRPYQWVVAQTASGPFEIRPANGEDLYWFDKFGIGAVLVVEPGSNVQPPQGYFSIVPAN